MTTFSNSPQVLKGGIVLIEPESARVLGIVSLQYNPESLTRTLQIQSAGGEGGQRSEPLPLQGRGGGDDQARRRDRRGRPARVSRSASRRGRARHPAAARGAGSARASIERAARRGRPPGGERHARDRADGGAAHALRVEQDPHRPGPAHRLQHHRGSVRSGAQPDPREGEPRFARAEVDDLGFAHKGGSLFMAYLQTKEQLAAKAQAGAFAALGIGGIG